jgi:hypothetical protein
MNQDEAYFRQVQVVGGTVAWPHEQDICPDTLYLDSCRDQQKILEAIGTFDFREDWDYKKDRREDRR